MSVVAELVCKRLSLLRVLTGAASARTLVASPVNCQADGIVQRENGHSSAERNVRGIASARICFMCGERGHTPRMCPYRPTTSPTKIGVNFMNIVCMRCLLPGHEYEDCTNEAHPETELICERCDGKGHAENECPEEPPTTLPSAGFELKGGTEH